MQNQTQILLFSKTRTWHLKPGLYSMRVYTQAYACILWLLLHPFIHLIPIPPNALHGHMPTVTIKLQHVQLSRPAQTSDGIPPKEKVVPKSPRADILFCKGVHTDVQWHMRLRVYTFMHSTACTMQWRCTCGHKRGHLRPLPAHKFTWSINMAKWCHTFSKHHNNN